MAMNHTFRSGSSSRSVIHRNRIKFTSRTNPMKTRIPSFNQFLISTDKFISFLNWEFVVLD
uniref:Uncharacterized protein n=1 Tax=Solanum lycopersicum TaxID=4081 RepID=A0A3Q7EY53_SOLLC